MPSEKILEQKKQFVAELAEKLKGSCAGVMVDYKGITVADDTKLRADLRKAGVEYAVFKNTMLHLAIAEVGLGDLDPLLSGTTALAVSKDDPVAAARILSAYADADKNKKFKVKGGFVEGKVIDAAGVDALAKLPSRETLVAMALGGLNAPITSFVYVLNANITGLARALQAIADQKNA